MKRIIIATLVALGLVGTGFGIWFYTAPKTEESPAAGKRGAKVTPVFVVPVAVSAVPIVLEATGTAEAEQSVAVRAEAGGVLRKIHFREGDAVKAGQLLFQLDASVSQAEVDKARANLARDQAAAREARAQMRRLQPLAEMEYVTQQEFAQAVAQEQAAMATVRADQAALKAVQAQFDYTRITAPISGRAGILNVKPGNLVSAASTTPLVTINATRPILVAFSAPQQQLQAVREQQRKHALQVEVNRDGQVAGKGVLAFIDNAVDTQTGTIRMKARLPNLDEAVWPGELVTLRLILGVEQNALVIPETALQQGQNGAFVYVVQDGKAHPQPIKVARQVGSQIVVGAGLQAEQQVIVNPPSNLRPEGAVEVRADKGGKP